MGKVQRRVIRATPRGTLKDGSGQPGLMSALNGSDGCGGSDVVYRSDLVEGSKVSRHSDLFDVVGEVKERSGREQDVSVFEKKSKEVKT